MLGSKNWIVSLECKREMKRKSESNDAHTVYQLGDEKQTICVVYMKCSQHRLNANKHLIRFGAVVSVLCCARLCLDRALTHSFTRRLCVCVCALHSFVVHSFSVAFNAVLVAFDIAIYTYHVWDQAMCVRLPLLYTFSLVVLCRSGCGCWYVRVFRVTAFTCVWSRNFIRRLHFRYRYRSNTHHTHTRTRLRLWMCVITCFGYGSNALVSISYLTRSTLNETRFCVDDSCCCYRYAV